MTPLKSPRAVLVCLGVLLCAPRALAAPASNSAAPIRFHTCVIRSATGLRSKKARCGRLSVPENRNASGGKHIKLFVAIVPSKAARPAPDPLFFIAGGPGESAVDGFFNTRGAFAAVLKHRDVVLVDQRGTGKSNALDCPQTGSGLGRPTAAQRTARLKACLKQLDGDPRYYTTSVAIADLDAVRKALGAKRIDLYGISYGTRVALEYLRYYGEHVRAVVLDGVVPADLSLGPRVSLNAAHALDDIFKRCAKAPQCARHFPALKSDFRHLNQRLENHPAQLTIADSLTGAPKPITLTQQKFANGVRLLTYASETSSLLPLLIHQGAAGYLKPFAGLVGMINSQLAQSLSAGMHLAVLCTEDVPFYTQAQLHGAETRRTWAGGQSLAVLSSACKVWPRGVIRRGFKKPVKSARPVLLISGANDPITPPRNAVHAAKTLANSLSIVVPGQGHGNVFRGCLPRVVAAFIQSASVDNLATDCVKRIQPAPFFLTFTGPAP